jgi:hypothetical protein
MALQVIIVGGGKDHQFVATQGSQASPARPSDERSMKVNTWNGYK